MSQNSGIAITLLLLLLLLASLTPLADAARKLTFRYIGCFAEGNPNARDLGGMKGLTSLGPYSVASPIEGLIWDSRMSHELCSEICSLGGFTYFGVQYSVVCSCDFSYGSYGKAAEASCSASCGGNSAQKCGASFRNSMFEITYLDGHNFKPAAKTSAPVVKVSPGYSVSTGVWSVAGNLADCLVACQMTDRCQMVLLATDGRCQLLPFAAVPQSAVALQGELWARP